MDEFSSNFPIDFLGQEWYLIVSIPDLCPFSYFDALFGGEKKSNTILMASTLFLWSHKYFVISNFDQNYVSARYLFKQILFVLYCIFVTQK